MTVEEAMRRLAVIPDYDPGGGEGPGPCVHTYVPTPIGLLGAHWRLPAVEAFFTEWGVDESGPIAADMYHGLVVTTTENPPRTIFFETKS